MYGHTVVYGHIGHVWTHHHTLYRHTIIFVWTREITGIVINLLVINQCKSLSLICMISIQLIYSIFWHIYNLWIVT